MSKKVKKEVCAGLDVHKNNVWACIAVKDPSIRKETIRYFTRKFESNHTDLQAMSEWLYTVCLQYYPNMERSSLDVYMESTGKYSTPVYNVLEDQGLNPFIVNPKHVKTINGQKSDQKDCAWIAELGMAGLLRSSYVPCRAIREARRISRTRTKLMQTRGDDIRRVHNILTEANIRIDLIFADLQGESARDVIKYLLTTDSPTLGGVRSRIRKTCRIVTYTSEKERKEKEEKLLKAFSGAKFSFSQKFELQKAFERIEYNSGQISSYENMMKEILKPFKCQLEILQTVPGISEISAMQILAEIGPDMDSFKNADSFINWLGLCPARNTSNGKHKSVKIGKSGRYLKPTLMQCALAAKKKPYFKNKFEGIASRKGKKRALIAIGRKMMVCIFHMLKTGEIF